MSNDSNKININFGSSLFLVLGTILLILKLAEVIQWSWWIVLIPFYPLFLVLFVLIIYFFIGMLIGLMEFFDRKK
jgi:hypothetical protein